MTSAYVIKHGAGNLKSLSQALLAAGFADVKFVSDPDTIMHANHLILPGVGSFKAASTKLRSQHIDEAILNVAAVGRPVLGICLGMQLLAEKSSEHGESEGLGLIPGSVEKIPVPVNCGRFPLPMIGWMKLLREHVDASVSTRYIFEAISKDFYFVHSYQFNVTEAADLKAFYTYFGQSVPAIVERENIVGVQFHPEKSAIAGIEFLRNFRQHIRST